MKQKEPRQYAEPDWGLVRAENLLEVLNYQEWGTFEPSEETPYRWFFPAKGELAYFNLDEPQAEECQQILRKYMDAWLLAQSDVSKWAFKDRFLKAVNRRRADLYRRAGGAAELVFDSLSDDPDAETWAVYLLLPYITGAYFNRLGRCVRCDKYYLGKTRRGNRKYCSDTCNKYASSVKHSRAARSKVHQEKLDLVRAAIHAFNALKTAQRAKYSSEWKGWVKNAVNAKLRHDPALRVTQNFITRALSKGEIEAPAGVESAVQ